MTLFTSNHPTSTQLTLHGQPLTQSPRPGTKVCNTKKPLMTLKAKSQPTNPAAFGGGLGNVKLEVDVGD